MYLTAYNNKRKSMSYVLKPSPNPYLLNLSLFPHPSLSPDEDQRSDRKFATSIFSCCYMQSNTFIMPQLQQSNFHSNHPTLSLYIINPPHTCAPPPTPTKINKEYLFSTLCNDFPSPPPPLPKFSSTLSTWPLLFPLTKPP